MNLITKQKLSAFHALLSKHGLMDHKPAIVQDLSNGRATSSKDLYMEEIEPWLQQMNLSKAPQKDKRQRMVNSIIAMATEIGMVKWETRIFRDGFHRKRNYTDMHAWIEKYGYLKKHINDYTYEELPTLVTQFKNMYLSKLNAKK
jgi:hypothetical protein